MKIRIKQKLGFCEKKGCWNRYSASLDIHGCEKDGELREVIKDYCICDQHLREFLSSKEMAGKADLMWEAESLHSSESIQLREFNEEEIENVGNLFDNPEMVKGTIYEKISKIGM